MRSLTFLFSTALMSLPLEAQQRVESTASAPFVLEAGELQLQELVEHAGDYLGVNILIDTRECTQALPIKLDRKVSTDREGCLDVVTSLLYRSGFAMLPLDVEHGLHEVVMINGTRGREIGNRAERKSVAEILARPNRYVPVMTTVQLEHINAQLANNALRPFFASNSSAGSLAIGNVGNRASLLLSGWQPQVAHALRVLAECDQPGGLDMEEETMRKQLAKLEARIEKLEKQLAALDQGR